MSYVGKTSEYFDRLYDQKHGIDLWAAKAHNAFDVIPLQTVKEIENGLSGKILLMHSRPCDNVPDPLSIAAKVFEFNNNNKDRNTQWFLREAGILQSLHHKHIVRCFAPVISPSCAVILMEFVPDGSLVSHIDILTNQDIHRYFIQISCALRYIHSKRIVHRDIKPENIMIRKQSAIIIDFGLSVYLPCSGCSILQGFAGTPPYMAPELRAHPEAEYDAIKSDSFSLGVTLWCMMLKELPDENTRFTPFVFPRKMDSILTFCMRRLLRTVPGSRFVVTELLDELVRRGYRGHGIESL